MCRLPGTLGEKGILIGGENSQSQADLETRGRSRLLSTGETGILIGGENSQSQADF